MKSRQTIWIVDSPGEGVPGPAIPTLGNPTSVNDLFRVVAIHETGHEGWNSCYTDPVTCSSLARLIEGPLTSFSDLLAAESALQLLMWHDRVDVMVPGFKYRMGNIVGYARSDDSRSDLAFELFRPLEPYDQIFAVEEAIVREGLMKESNLPDSALIGRNFQEALCDYLSVAPLQAAALSSVPLAMSVPAYFNDPRLIQFTGKRGFFGQFYDIMARDWYAATSAIPDVELTVNLPPLLALVRDRTSSRGSIPDAIRELREELAPVREEMLDFSEMVRGARDQRGIEERAKSIKASFEAAFKASRYEQTILFPLLKLYKAVKSPLDTLIKILNPAYQFEDPRLVANRTVTGKTFARLLATDSMHTLTTNFLTTSEIVSIQRSLASRSGA